MRTLIITLAAALMLAIPASAKQNDAGLTSLDLISIIDEYRHNDGFEVVKIGSIGTSAIKSIARISALSTEDPDARELIRIINGIKKVAIVDFDDCDDQVKGRFRSKIEKSLGASDLLMEVKDGDDKVYLYGVINENASKIKDFVMYVPSDCAMICLFGSISTDALAKLTK